MRSSFHLFFPGCILLLIGACSAPSNTSPTTDISTNAPSPSRALRPVTPVKSAVTLLFSGDSLKRFFRPDAEIIHAQLAADTLLLASTGDFVFYPFGKCATSSCLQKRCAPLQFKTKHDVSLQRSGIYTGRFNRSYVQAAQTVEQDTLMSLVAGELHDPGIRFTNGIQVGMSKAQLLGVFCKTPLGEPARIIQVVQVDSGLDGMHHYYVCSGDTLRTIRLVSLLSQALGQ